MSWKHAFFFLALHVLSITAFLLLYFSDVYLELKVLVGIVTIVMILSSLVVGRIGNENSKSK